MRTLGLTMAILALAMAGLRAQDTDEKVRKLSNELELEFSRGAETGSPPAQPWRLGAPMELTRFLSAVKSGNKAAIGSALVRLTAYVDSAPIRQECLDLEDILQREQQAHDKKLIDDTEAALDKVGNAVRAASIPADLDSSVAQLDQILAQNNAYLFGPPNSVNPLFTTELNKVQEVRRFVTQWQDGLSNLAAGHTRSGVQALRMVSQLNVSFFPRSAVLARIDELDAKAEVETAASAASKPQLAETIGQIKTLDDLGAAIDALDKVGRIPGDSRHAQAEAASRILSPLEQDDREFRAGQSVNILDLVNRTSQDNTASAYQHLEALGGEDVAHAIAGVLPGLRSQLLLLALPRVLDLPTMKAAPGEGPIEFLRRVETEELAAGDYVAAAKAEEMRASLSTGESSGEPSTQATAFVAGDRLDTARQYALAVAEYERALAGGSNLVPARMIGDRLDAIKEKHPQEFELGQRLYFSPETRPDLFFPSPRLLRQVGRVNEQQTPPESSSIPHPGAAPGIQPANLPPK